MGWKYSSIIVKDFNNTNYQETLRKLGFKGLVKTTSKTHYESLVPAANEVYITTYNNHLIINLLDFPSQLLAPYAPPFEQKLISVFPTSEIAINVMSIGNIAWGIGLIQSGTTVRLIAVNEQNERIVSFGEHLEHEKPFLKDAIVWDGKVQYRQGEFVFNERAMIDFGMDFYARYLGTPLEDAVDFNSFHMMDGYTFTSVDVDLRPESAVDKLENKLSDFENFKPWWKFW
ncbi:hypothetical protein [Cytophaga aurantiaca]|uniref:hypothetical protein n=1 Tax=Cytophaga aurantiaca TaxID=29530 RepID=UPI00036BD62F|nr:hypothetical protein [Cytophaga aurantiaca]